MVKSPYCTFTFYERFRLSIKFLTTVTVAELTADSHARLSVEHTFGNRTDVQRMLAYYLDGCYKESSQRASCVC